MGNTVLEGEFSIEITGLDADFIAGVNSTYRLYEVFGIEFVPSAVNDRMIVRHAGIDLACILDTGPVINLAAIYEKKPLIWYQPVIDITDCTLSTPANAKVIFHFRQRLYKP